MAVDHSENDPAHRLDVVGYLCPVPVHETRRVLQQIMPGELLEVLADDPETKHDIPLLLARVGAELVSLEDVAGEFRFLIRAGEER